MLIKETIIGKKVAERASTLYWYSNDSTGKTGIDIQPEEIARLIDIVISEENEFRREGRPNVN